jgi:hypothetical protein
MNIDIFFLILSLTHITLFANTDVSITEMYLDISILSKSNMGWSLGGSIFYQI